MSDEVAVLIESISPVEFGNVLLCGSLTREGGSTILNLVEPQSMSKIRITVTCAKEQFTRVDFKL